MKTDYQKQADDFLTRTNTSFQATFLRHDKHFTDDKDTRDIYRITLKRGGRGYAFNFGQSINCSGQYKVVSGCTLLADAGYHKGQGLSLSEYKKALIVCSNNPGGLIVKNENFFSEPTAYDVLACLTKYDPGDFENFCSDYGYDTDSRKAEKIYKSVLDEWHNVAMLWNDEELELLREIQ
jgi:hypothetical protein